MASFHTLVLLTLAAGVAWLRRRDAGKPSLRGHGGITCERAGAEYCQRCGQQPLRLHHLQSVDFPEKRDVRPRGPVRAPVLRQRLRGA